MKKLKKEIIEILYNALRDEGIPEIDAKERVKKVETDVFDTIDRVRERDAKIVEEMMEDYEHWQPIAGRILGRTIISKDDLFYPKSKE